MDFKEFNGAELTAFLIAGKISSNNPGITGEYVDGFFDWIDQPSNRMWLREEIVDWPIVDEPEEPEEPTDCESNFDISIVQTHQLNGECGLWYLKMWLEIKYELDGVLKWQSDKSGEIFIRDSSGNIGKFRTDFSDVPCNAKITSVKLCGSLEPDEGLAWGDKESTFEIRDADGLVHSFSAAGMHGRGWNKSHPEGSFDLTVYVKGLRQ